MTDINHAIWTALCESRLQSIKIKLKYVQEFACKMPRLGLGETVEFLSGRLTRYEDWFQTFFGAFSELAAAEVIEKSHDDLRRWLREQMREAETLQREFDESVAKLELHAENPLPEDYPEDEDGSDFLNNEFSVGGPVFSARFGEFMVDESVFDHTFNLLVTDLKSALCALESTNQSVRAFYWGMMQNMHKGKSG